MTNTCISKRQEKSLNCRHCCPIGWGPGQNSEEEGPSTFTPQYFLLFFPLLLLPTDIRLQILNSLKQSCTKNSHGAYTVQPWAEDTSLVLLVLRRPDYWTSYRFPQHSGLQTWDRSPYKHISQSNKVLLSIIPTFSWLCSSEKVIQYQKNENFPIIKY